MLQVLDEAAHPRVRQGAFDELFVGQTPVLMGVEPTSFCWLLGEVAEHRDGATWAGHFARFPALEHAITDAGTGLAKGLALANQQRRASLPAEPEPLLIEQSLDVFHTQREGSRAWRATEARVWQLHDRAQQLWKPLDRRREQGLSLRGQTQAAQAADRRAEAALEEAVRIETAWNHARAALDFFTPDGRLNTVAAARAALDQWLPQLAGETWAKTVRLLERPESLTFLARLERQLQHLSLPDDLKDDALRYEGLCRRPAACQGEDPASRGRRAWWLVATVRYSRDEVFRTAVTTIRRVLRECCRASSLVEGINSVVRMQQARHRKLTPGLVSLKRLYWNCRPFRTGPRRGKTPYDLLGLTLPTCSWWELLKMPLDELKQKLSTSVVTL